MCAVGAAQAMSQLLFVRSELPPPPMQLRMSRSTANDASTRSNHENSEDVENATESGITTATLTTASSLPKPFDSNLGNNFTTSTCPEFFQSFLNDAKFEACLPLSLLLQTSNSFFAASQSLVHLTRTLDATCHVDYPQCSAMMASLATQIQSSSNCQADYQMENPNVWQAYHGFQSYDALYHAGCLTDSQGGYCFADAVTNASAPTAGYVYYLPLGVPLPVTTRPTCNTCLQDTMAVFAAAATTNRSQPLATDYSTAARQVNSGCGPAFVETLSLTSGAAALALGGSTVSLLLSFCVLLVCAF